jgi:hypothetical protein
MTGLADALQRSRCLACASCPGAGIPRLIGSPTASLRFTDPRRHRHLTRSTEYFCRASATRDGALAYNRLDRTDCRGPRRPGARRRLSAGGTRLATLTTSRRPRRSGPRPDKLWRNRASSCGYWLGQRVERGTGIVKLAALVGTRVDRGRRRWPAWSGGALLFPMVFPGLPARGACGPPGTAQGDVRLRRRPLSWQIADGCRRLAAGRLSAWHLLAVCAGARIGPCRSSTCPMLAALAPPGSWPSRPRSPHQPNRGAPRPQTRPSRAWPSSPARLGGLIRFRGLPPRTVNRGPYAPGGAVFLLEGGRARGTGLGV